ncbi:MAG: MiaB/RimO family radical SAM methylthiotransferase [Chitinispirillaceae bacterium]|nr:MiaB/RimO family radical SAM methylthiotransferase [Chitinispirillaceae bacterium]
MAHSLPFVALRSVGCRTNQQEMAALEREFIRSGYSLAGDLSGAAIVVVNTCSVTAHTESKVRRLLSHIARQAPGASICVTGCMAQQKGAEFLSRKNVRWIIGNGRKHEIPAILGSSDGGIFVTPPARDPLALSSLTGSPSPGGRTRFSVKIQEGCDFACSYCIVPQLRGPARSAPAETVVSLCARAIEAGFREIVLTGTHIGQYRDPAGGLLSLLERLLRLPGDFRIRLSSLDPRELSGQLLSMIAEEPKLCDHLHVSLQHLSPGVLAAMDRPYRALDAIVRQLVGFRESFPGAGLGADFIVGFPGETDTRFEELVSGVRRIGFSYAHIFRFSPRPGTRAPLMRGAVDETVKRERSARLQKVVDESRRSFLRLLSGSVRTIIVEQEQPVRGVTSNYCAVEIPACSALHNSWLDVIIEGTGSGRWCRARVPAGENG